MSRVGKQKIDVPDGVSVKVQDGHILVNGPKGELKQFLPDFFKIKMQDNKLSFSVSNPDIKKQKAIWGTFARLIFNMMVGVTEGFEKKLELVGVGYRVNLTGDKLVLKVGFSHPVEFLLPKGVDAQIKQNIITISGIDKQLVGEIAAQIRRIKKPEPYKGKGIKYVDEVIRRKAGKKAVGATA